MEKSQAIVLKVLDFSETSTISTLFTEDFGKITALAKGARRPKGPFEAALDLLSVCRVVFIHKSSDALDLLTEARLERRFRAAGRDLSRLYAGYYLAELLKELTDEGDPHPELFRAAERTLAGLDGEGDVAALVLRLEMNAIRLLGHLPTLDACAACGRPVTAAQKPAFGLLAGGLLCERCRPGHRSVVRVSPGAIESLRRFADEREEPAGIELKRESRGELRGLMNQFLGHLAGKRFRMHKYLAG